jgi:nitrite reductase (NO-forming)
VLDRPLPASRWRRHGAPAAAPKGAAGRVIAAQRQARDGFALTLAFTVAALVTAATGPRTGAWLPLHLFLAGGVMSAISAATVLFAVTWSAGPAPSRWLTASQQALIAAGAIGVAAGRELSGPGWVLDASALVFVAGLVTLATLVTTTVARGRERRFDVAVSWYVAAAAAGVVGVAFGLSMATGGSLTGGRTAHVTLQLLGLVGLVIGGTLPTFAATLARTRLSPRATPTRHLALLAVEVAAIGTAVAGALLGAGRVAAAGYAAYAAGVAALATLLPRPTRRSLQWAGPRLIGAHLALAWWTAAVAAAAWRSATGADPLPEAAVAILVIAGFAQLAWAALAYLGPVVRGGGHERLAAGFARTRSWPALIAFNVAGLAAVIGWGTVVALAVAAAAVDTLARHSLLAFAQRKGTTP